eukprot:2566530-Rhodomonas_salina.1
MLPSMQPKLRLVQHRQQPSRHLSKKFTLSYSGKLSWYLSVAIDHGHEKGITYIDTLLEQFSITDAHPVPTLSEPGSHLVKAQ